MLKIEVFVWVTVNCIIPFRSCITNGVTKSDVKEVMKKPVENAPKRKDDEKQEWCK